MNNTKKRMEKDVMKLILSDYDILIKDENKMNEFSVVFKGPKDSPYENGIWQIEVLLPEHYPYKSPSIGFSNKIYHPNIDEASGSVCLDVINQTWSPMYELKNIFDVFLPQLLIYPNPTDPLNSQAAKLLLSNKEKYEETVKNHVMKHASSEIKLKKEVKELKIIQKQQSTKVKEEDELSNASFDSLDAEELSGFDELK